MDKHVAILQKYSRNSYIRVCVCVCVCVCVQVYVCLSVKSGRGGVCVEGEGTICTSNTVLASYLVPMLIQGM